MGIKKGIPNIRKFISKPEFSIIVIFVLMFVVSAVLQSNFFERDSIVRNINAFTPLILLVIGQSIVIISGGLDLSVGTSLSFLASILTTVMKADSPTTGVYAILIAFAAAMLIGVVNGFAVGYMRISPVIVTFASSFIWLGGALLLRPRPGGEAVSWFPIFYKIDRVESVPEFLKTLGLYTPPGLIFIIVGIILWLILSKTMTGRHIYAVGSNPESSYMSGINTAKTQLLAYMTNSVFIFFTALFFVGQNLSADARMGDPLPLKVIAACVVGGIALTGGRGNINFAILGALIMSLVGKIIFFANIPNEYQTLVSGIIVIIAIVGSQAYTLTRQKDLIKGEKKIT